MAKELDFEAGREAWAQLQRMVAELKAADPELPPKCIWEIQQEGRKLGAMLNGIEQDD